jgi:oxygen-independent coproporphyrinogen III oxidase
VFDDYFAAEWPRLRALADDGLVDIGAGEITLTARGRLLMRNVAMTFDAYLARRTEQPLQSRAI